MLLEEKKNELKNFSPNQPLSKIGVLTLLVSGSVVLLILAFILMITLWSPSEAFQALPRLLIIFFALILIILVPAFKLPVKIKSLLNDARQRPYLITLGFLLNTLAFMYWTTPPFAPQEIDGFKNTWPVYLFSWLAFAITENPKVLAKIKQNNIANKLFWVIRAPVLAVIFFTALMFIEVDGSMFIFSIFDLLKPAFE